MRLEKILKIYKYASIYLTGFLIILNIILTLINELYNYYMYVISIFTPIFICITPYFLYNFFNGLINKENHKIIRYRERVIGKKAIKSAIFSLLVFLLCLGFFAFFEFWMIFWIFLRN